MFTSASCSTTRVDGDGKPITVYLLAEDFKKESIFSGSRNSRVDCPGSMGELLYLALIESIETDSFQSRTIHHRRQYTGAPGSYLVRISVTGCSIRRSGMLSRKVLQVQSTVLAPDGRMERSLSEGESIETWEQAAHFASRLVLGSMQPVFGLEKGPSRNPFSR